MKDDYIALFDSGVGGMSVLKELLHFLPNEKYIYFGDTENLPFGNKSDSKINIYAQQWIKYLKQFEKNGQNIKLIIIACNTVSAIAIDIIRNMTDIPVIDVITPIMENINYKLTRNKKNIKIGVIGTKATIHSNIYNKLLNINKKQNVITGVSCPLFVPLIEEYFLNHKVTELIIEEYLKCFKDYDILIMGCTHYPFLKNKISNYLPKVSIENPADYVVLETIKVLSSKNLLNDSKHNTYYIKIYLTEITEQFVNLTKNFLDFNAKDIIHIFKFTKKEIIFLESINEGKV